ncbi:hypothetical protein GUJ93_ZPchr0007g3415 [Zizania palustris]|uniref:Uncharacterized protein n=1 Tax=Zizania palustris TaxID=103762 RepID=A0A8J5VZE3_ZIZPA|nr:hypothetical protein GUJ93_ZPchr0007g3415 [Zizania palustris]
MVRGGAMAAGLAIVVASRRRPQRPSGLGDARPSAETKALDLRASSGPPIATALDPPPLLPHWSFQLPPPHWSLRRRRALVLPSPRCSAPLLPATSRSIRTVPAIGSAPLHLPFI